MGSLFSAVEGGQWTGAVMRAPVEEVGKWKKKMQKKQGNASGSGDTHTHTHLMVISMHSDLV